MPHLLLAMDFDGTIAPIVSDPNQASIDREAATLLARCSELDSVAVAIISGRDTDDLRSRAGDVRAFMIGSHGLECVDPDGNPIWHSRHALPQPDSDLIERLRVEGFHPEFKKYSIAVHYRHWQGRGDEEALSAFVCWARGQSLDIIEGRKVIEARAPGISKLAALRFLAARVRADRVIYAGDDTTDFDSLAFASERGKAIFMENNERRAPDIQRLSRVESIHGLCGLISRELDH
jgi:trehalose-phosphatase